MEHEQKMASEKIVGGRTMKSSIPSAMKAVSAITLLDCVKGVRPYRPKSNSQVMFEHCLISTVDDKRDPQLQLIIYESSKREQVRVHVGPNPEIAKSAISAALKEQGIFCIARR
jgi:hypothetical protein